MTVAPIRKNTQPIATVGVTSAAAISQPRARIAVPDAAISTGRRPVPCAVRV